MLEPSLALAILRNVHFLFFFLFFFFFFFFVFFRRRRFLLRRSLRCFVFFVFLLLLTFLFLFFLQLAIGSYGFLFPALFFLLFFFCLHGILLQLIIIIIIILLLRLLLLCISINGGFVRLCRRFFDGNIHLQFLIVRFLLLRTRNFNHIRHDDFELRLLDEEDTAWVHRESHSDITSLGVVVLFAEMIDAGHVKRSDVG